MEEVEFTTTRTSPKQFYGVVHFVDEAGNKVVDDIEVYFYDDQLVDVKVPYYPGFYSDRPEVWSWTSFDETIVYHSERPLMCMWDDPAYYELRTLVPGQY